MRAVEKERVERAARLYGCNRDASRALGITSQAFGRMCKRYGIETQHARDQRRRQEARHLHSDGACACCGDGQHAGPP